MPRVSIFVPLLIRSHPSSFRALSRQRTIFAREIRLQQTSLRNASQFKPWGRRIPCNLYHAQTALTDLKFVDEDMGEKRGVSGGQSRVWSQGTSVIMSSLAFCFLDLSRFRCPGAFNENAHMHIAAGDAWRCEFRGELHHRRYLPQVTRVCPWSSRRSAHTANCLRLMHSHINYGAPFNRLPQDNQLNPLMRAPPMNELITREPCDR